MQTRKGSLFEVSCNVGTGMIVSWFLTIYLFPVWFNLPLSTSQSWTIVIIYTAVSIVRSYIWRRIFNWFIIKEEEKYLYTKVK